MTVLATWGDWLPNLTITEDAGLLAAWGDWLPNLTITEDVGQYWPHGETGYPI
jgi:hypothetical protein